MKTIKRIPIHSLTLLLAYLVFMPVALAQDIIIAISPYQQNAVINIKQVLKHLTTLETGSKAVLIDGFNFKKIAVFKVPTQKTSPKAMLKRNAKAVGALLRFAKTESNSQTAPIVANVLRLPQLLRHIAENYAYDKDAGLDVIVLGSPFYDDPAEPNISMADAHIPSDGHINASRTSSPYGTADNTELLNNIRLHLGFSIDAEFINDRHRFFIRRFWTLYIERLGGKLVSFISDKETLFDRMKNKAKALTHNFTLEPSTKLEMIRLRRDKAVNSIYERELSNQNLTRRDILRAENVEIGISWDCDICDLDLYARGQPNADILYFGRKQTSMGNHWKDFTISPSLSNGYETISFKVALNLQQLLIAVNFYEGNAPNGITGSLRISANGQTYEQSFSITAITGNKGTGIDVAFETGKSPSKHILMFDPLKIIKRIKG